MELDFSSRLYRFVIVRGFLACFVMFEDVLSCFRMFRHIDFFMVLEKMNCSVVL